MLRSIKITVLITALFAGITACRSNYQLISVEYANFEMTPESYPADTVILQYYQPFKEKLDAGMDQVIGYSQAAMIKERPESRLTNYLADLLLEEAALVASGFDVPVVPDVAFLNYGGIRTGFPAGEITVRKIFELMPFENELVLLKLSYTGMQEFLDLIALRGGESLSGARFRISGGKALDVTIGGSPVSSGREYWLATSDFIADGGDNFTMLQGSLERRGSDLKVRDLIIRHIRRNFEAGKVIDPEMDGRITNE